MIDCTISQYAIQNKCLLHIKARVFFVGLVEKFIKIYYNDSDKPEFMEFLIMSYLLVFSPVILSATIFAVSVVLFIIAKEQPELRKKRKVYLAVSSVLFGAVILAYIGIAILFSIAIRNM